MAPARPNEPLCQPRSSVRYFMGEQAAQLQSHMPDVEDVREEARAVKEIVKKPLPEIQHVSFAGTGTLHPGLAYRIQIVKLFAFAYWCHVEDGEAFLSASMHSSD
ncbi:hypothetical protein V5O48_013936 [Marasmius crinis-equi]|uniref:Uncharacterized protein n=1 Tax=Marasmius crinis-equi TaxID=585013 RepID=A0ABR3EZ22_9AGAR